MIGSRCRINASGDRRTPCANIAIRCVKMDPITILTVMGMATERMGLGSTCSTTYYEPFHVARVFQTLDLMTNGRAAWNIVTSMNDGEALNMGHAAHGEHDQRYDRADEFLEVVMGHWDSWDDDALVIDRKTGTFAHPDKVRRLDHQGEYFRSRGPFTVPRSPQGHPVLIQAGQSGRGRRFAARWAELVFVNYHSLEHARVDYAEFKQQVAATGRDPEKLAVAAGVYTVVAETRAEAEDKVAMIDNLPKEIDQLSLLCEVLNVDLAQKPIDEPWTRRSGPGLERRGRDRVYPGAGKRNPGQDFVGDASWTLQSSSVRRVAEGSGGRDGEIDCATLALAMGCRWQLRVPGRRGVCALHCPRTATPRPDAQGLSWHHVAGYGLEYVLKGSMRGVSSSVREEENNEADVFARCLFGWHPRTPGRD